MDQAFNLAGDTGPEEGWVVCRVFKKKNYHKAVESPLASSPSILPRNDGVLDQLIMYMGRSSSCKQETDHSTMHFPGQPSAAFLHLPELLESPNINDDCSFKPPPNEMASDWATLDRLVASQLNGGQPPKQFPSDDFSFSLDHDEQVQQLMNMNNSDRGNETDLWTFARSSSLSSSSSDPLCHLSV